jgi:hypothetical protein
VALPPTFRFLRSLFFVCFAATALVSCTDYDLVSRNDAFAPLLNGDRTDSPFWWAPPDTGSASAGVSGRVCDPSGGDWVVGALASTWMDTDGDGVDEEFGDLTDVDGRYLLHGMPGGPTTITIEKGSFSAEVDVELIEGEILELPDPTCLDASSVEIAVVTGHFDDIGAILDELAVDYDSWDGVYSDTYVSLLTDYATLSSYDIVFLNCGIDPMEHQWYGQYADVVGNLRAFVAAGGSIYASDWSYFFLEASHPDLVDFYGEDSWFGSALVGDAASTSAQVIDSNMQMLLGSPVASLDFDLDQWAVPTSTGSVDVLVQGDVSVMGGGVSVTNAPLALQYTNDQEGRILYTAFHNEAQATLDMVTLLKEIVLSL